MKMALFVKKGNYIWNLETEYQGAITDENAIEYIIGWYFNARSGEGYKNETVPKNLVDDIGKEEMLVDKAEPIESEEVASANYEGEFSEATINRIREREDARQRKIFENAEGCSEGRRLFSIAWDAPAEDHGARYADYLEHLTKCNECIATFKLTDANIQRLKNDADGYRRGAEVLKKERSKPTQ